MVDRVHKSPPQIIKALHLLLMTALLRLGACVPAPSPTFQCTPTTPTQRPALAPGSKPRLMGLGSLHGGSSSVNRSALPAQCRMHTPPTAWRTPDQSMIC